MRSFIIALITCSVTMSLLGIAYMALFPLLARRYSEKGRYYAWMIIIVGLIIPFRPHFAGAVINVDFLKDIKAVIGTDSSSAVLIRNMSTDIENIYTLDTAAALDVNGKAVIPIESEDDNPNYTIHNMHGMQSDDLAAHAGIYNTDIPLSMLIAIAWLAGVTAFAVYHGLRYRSFIKTAMRWSEAINNDNVLALLENIKAEMDIVKGIDVYTCSGITGPMLIGFIKPRILIPKANFAPDMIRFILKHELIHYKRRDLWCKLMIMIAMAMHWFNPVVYLIAKMTEAACELSCDAETVLGGDADVRMRYSETIISVIKNQSKRSTKLATNLYGGKRGMKRRILSIMDIGEKKTGAVILCCILILTLGTGITFAADASRQKNTVDIETAQMTETQTGTEAYQAVIIRFDPEDGKKYYKWGSSNNWIKLTDEEFNEMNEASEPNWYTYEEYEAITEQGIANFQALVDDNVTFYSHISDNGSVYYHTQTMADCESTDTAIGYTQADANKFKQVYQSVLNGIQGGGYKVSKEVESVNGGEIRYNLDYWMQSISEISGFDGENSEDENIFIKYAPYQLRYDDQLCKLYYKGELVRYFEDSYPLFDGVTASVTSFDEDGTVDVYAVRDPSSIINNDDGSQKYDSVLTDIKPYSQAEFNARDIEKLTDSLFNAPTVFQIMQVKN